MTARSPSKAKPGAGEVLTACGLRCTRQREVVYDALRSTTRHPTAEELFDSVRRAEPGISLATVYNTLDALTGAGRARRLPAHSYGGPCRYDADVANHAHVLLEDGRIVDAPRSVSERLLEAMTPEMATELERIAGVRITGVRLTLIGEQTRSEA